MKIFKKLSSLLKQGAFSKKGKMDKFIVNTPILKLQKGVKVGFSKEQAEFRKFLITPLGGGIYETLVPFDLKKNEEILIDLDLLPKSLLPVPVLEERKPNLPEDEFSSLDSFPDGDASVETNVSENIEVHEVFDTTEPNDLSIQEPPKPAKKAEVKKQGAKKQGAKKQGAKKQGKKSNPFDEK